jgi:hypothetical protein
MKRQPESARIELSRTAAGVTDRLTRHDGEP